MRSLKSYILEADDEKQEKDEGQSDIRKNIKFTIWEEPDKKLNWLTNNEKYQKIEYKHIDKENKIEIDFLLGFDKIAKSWKLWIGKIGATNYDDDPYYDLKTTKFAEAITFALDKIEEFIEEVKSDPQNWIQYYKNM